MSRRSVVALLAALLVTALSACVGPARTTAQYEGKATRTANDAQSNLATALLAVRTSQRGRLLGRSLRVVLSESEDAYDSIQTTFDSIQPPETARADALRSQLDAILSDGADSLSQLRIAARRSDQPTLLKTAAALPGVIDRLEKFVADVTG